MRYLVVALGAVCLMTACGSRNAKSGNAPQAVVGQQRAEESSAQIEGAGLKMLMFEADPTQSGTSRPSFRLHAGTIDGSQEESAYSLRDIRAVAYSQNGEETTFEAKRASMNQAKGEASLEEDVKIKAGVFTMAMQRVHWDNERGVAQSDTPVTIDHGTTHLTAAGMTLVPKSQSLLFRGLQGRFEFEKEKT